MNTLINKKVGNFSATEAKEIHQFVNSTLARNYNVGDRKPASLGEIENLLYISDKNGLDPRLKEIWAIRKKGQFVVMSARDGYLKIAQRHKGWDGMTSFVVHQNDTLKITENDTVIHEWGKPDRGNIIGAWAKVNKKESKPVIIYVPFNEYNQEKSPTWKSFPSAMIQKVAESMALKRQFGFSGLVSMEEMLAPEALKDMMNTGSDAPKSAPKKTIKKEKENEIKPETKAEPPKPEQEVAESKKEAEPEDAPEIEVIDMSIKTKEVQELWGEQMKIKGFDDSKSEKVMKSTLNKYYEKNTLDELIEIELDDLISRLKKINEKSASEKPTNNDELSEDMQTVYDQWMHYISEEITSDVVLSASKTALKDDEIIKKMPAKFQNEIYKAMDQKAKELTK